MFFDVKAYNKQYENLGEENRRFNIFIDNQKKIFKHNQLYSLGDATYTLKSNEFADLTHKEFVTTYMGSVTTHGERFVKPISNDNCSKQVH